MKIVVVGAGASLEQAIRLGIDRDYQPPLMGNFASRLWTSDFSRTEALVFMLRHYLYEHAAWRGGDPIAEFMEIESHGNHCINVEGFFEYAWRNRGRLCDGGWRDLIKGAVIDSFIDIFARGGYSENGVGWKPFLAYQAMVSHLNPGDIVLNLNYDPLFEMAAKQMGRKFSYIPCEEGLPELLVAKPHGSINLIVKENCFWFSDPDIIGTVDVDNESGEHYRGVVPPRRGKNYSQHPVAKSIFDAISDILPSHLLFWGVGFTDSDIDLTEFYRKWAKAADVVSVIHPFPKDEIEQAKKLLLREVCHFDSPENWRP